MITLGYDTVESFVEQQNRRGNTVNWDGWDLVFFSPSPRAVYVPNSQHSDIPEIRTGGEQREGKWGFKTIVAVNKEGKWRVPNRNVRFAKRNRPRPR